MSNHERTRLRLRAASIALDLGIAGQLHLILSRRTSEPAATAPIDVLRSIVADLRSLKGYVSRGTVTAEQVRLSILHNLEAGNDALAVVVSVVSALDSRRKGVTA